MALVSYSCETRQRVSSGAMTPEDLKAEDEFLEVQAKAMRERVAKKTRVYNLKDYGAISGEGDIDADHIADG